MNSTAFSNRTMGDCNSTFGPRIVFLGRADSGKSHLQTKSNVGWENQRRPNGNVGDALWPVQ